MDYFPFMNDAEVQLYRQLRRKILAGLANEQAEEREEKIELKVALSELHDEAPIEKPPGLWHGLRLKNGRNSKRENGQQGLIPEGSYSYQGMRGYGKLAARKAQ